MVPTSILTGVLSLSFLAGGLCLAETADAASAPLGITQNDTSIMIQNEFLTVEVQKIGRKLAGVVIQDKINGRSYDLGNDIFSILVCDEETDEACSKKEFKETFHTITAHDCKISDVKTEALAPLADARRIADRHAGIFIRLTARTR